MARRDVIIHGSSDNPQWQVPATEGIWINKAELDALPASGTPWTELVNYADQTVMETENIQDNNSKHNIQTLAPALVFARADGNPGVMSQASADAYRSKCATELQTLVDFTVAEGSITGPARNIAAYVIAADLIDLPTYDAQLNSSFRSWLNVVLDKAYTGAGGSVRGQCLERVGGNTRHYAMFSTLAAERYLGDDQAAIDALVVSAKRTVDISISMPGIQWTTDDAEGSWQPHPTDTTQWFGILPVGFRKDGHLFDGIQPNDYRRSSGGGGDNAYDPNDFPGPYQTDYPTVALEGLAAYTLVLNRMGYPAKEWGHQATYRAANRIKVHSELYGSGVYPTDPWPYFASKSGNPARQLIIPLINSMYGTSWTYSTSNSHRELYGYAFTMWTHQ